MSDTIYSKANETFYSELTNAPSGLVGTVGVRIIRKSDGVVVLARTTAGITEVPAGAGTYRAALTAPPALDAYAVLWDTGSVSPATVAEDDLIVTTSVAEVVEPPTTGKILTLAEYKKRRQLTEASMERDEATTAALEAAEDAVLQYTGRDFTTAEGVETRSFPWEIHTVILETDDFVGAPTGIELEVPGVGSGMTFPTNAFWLGPREGPTHYYIDFTPARGLSSPSIGAMGFTRNLDTYFSRSSGGPDAVNAKVTANFGWPGAAPASVKQAVTWLVDEFRKSDGTQGDVQAEAIANLSYVYQRISEEKSLPARITALLDPFRRVAL